MRKIKISKKILITVSITILSLIGIIALGMLYAKKIENNLVKKSVCVEIGVTPDLSVFLESDTLVEDASFVTDISEIDINSLGEYNIIVRVKRKEFESKLMIVDTVAPVGIAKELTVDEGIEIKAEDCVSDIQDATKVSVSFENVPDLSKEGAIKAVIILEDEAKNITKLDININVIGDHEPPIIEGVKDKTVYVGSSVSYKENITVKDDKDEKPTLEIDNSKVDLTKPGDYEVIYSAKDKAGNIAESKMTVHVIKKSEIIYSVESSQAKAKEIVAKILNDNMTERQKAFTIYRYVRTHIGYTGTSDKTNEAKEAYIGLSNGSGDCFTNYAAAKYLFDAAGIQNMEVIKSDTSHSEHFWNLINLGDGWYHVDCTPRATKDDFLFMVTDAELEAYSVTHNNCHVFDHSLYPATPTESIQSHINYSAGTVD